jgi:hypothetical protein
MNKWSPVCKTEQQTLVRPSIVGIACAFPKKTAACAADLNGGPTMESLDLNTVSEARHDEQDLSKMNDEGCPNEPGLGLPSNPGSEGLSAVSGQIPCTSVSIPGQQEAGLTMTLMEKS